jgi:hypothetical protein
MMISGVGVAVVAGVSVGRGVSLGVREGPAVGQGMVLVGVGVTSENVPVSSRPDRVPRAITSARSSPIQRISFGKVKAVWMRPWSSAMAAA